MDTKLKETLRQLHATLAHHGPVDEELQSLLRQLDGDIRQILDQPHEPEDGTNTYGLAERTQEITAKFAARHPALEPTLRELTRILGNMGI
jgi:ABC-type transporter Mla subunit MlaD